MKEDLNEVIKLLEHMLKELERKQSFTITRIWKHRFGREVWTNRAMPSRSWKEPGSLEKLGAKYTLEYLISHIKYINDLNKERYL